MVAVALGVGALFDVEGHVDYRHSKPRSASFDGENQLAAASRA